MEAGPLIMDDLSSILAHYFIYISGAADIHWDYENTGELQDAVERFEARILGVVEQRIAEALEEKLPEAIEQALRDRS